MGLPQQCKWLVPSPRQWRYAPVAPAPKSSNAAPRGPHSLAPAISEQKPKSSGQQLDRCETRTTQERYANTSAAINERTSPKCNNPEKKHQNKMSPSDMQTISGSAGAFILGSFRA
eukprot:1264442-Amphidinium_carterae.1